jgi:quercetin dioxygenase-like cupin family protein
MKNLSKTISVPRVVRNNGSRMLDVFGARVEFLVGPQQDEEAPCILKGTVPSGVSIPIHSHDVIEIMFILSGGIEMIVEDGGKKRWVEANAGDLIEIPSNAKHAFETGRKIR